MSNLAFIVCLNAFALVVLLSISFLKSISAILWTVLAKLYVKIINSLSIFLYIRALKYTSLYKEYLHLGKEKDRFREAYTAHLQSSDEYTKYMDLTTKIGAYIESILPEVVYKRAYGKKTNKKPVISNDKLEEDYLRFKNFFIKYNEDELVEYISRKSFMNTCLVAKYKHGVNITIEEKMIIVFTENISRRKLRRFIKESTTNAEKRYLVYMANEDKSEERIEEFFAKPSSRVIA